MIDLEFDHVSKRYLVRSDDSGAGRAENYATPNRLLTMIT